MRARLALRLSKQKIILREILLKDKPADMLQLSPKGTVPVLQLKDGTVLDESIDIAYWALQQYDPENYLPVGQHRETTDELISECDGDFKYYLDRYKYADRFPEKPVSHYREKGEAFLQRLDHILQSQHFLMGDKAALADIAIFPFVRQFAFVDKNWFDQSPYTTLQNWLQYNLESQLFEDIMHKVPVWQPQQEPIYL